jgi:hypothetical protein
VTKVPYWPKKMCELAKPPGFVAEHGSTDLIDLLKKENVGNDRASGKASKGYGHIPMRSLLNNDTAYLHDKNQGQVYEHDCTYGG